jgi:Secretion system C-terminal sorting domain
MKKILLFAALPVLFVTSAKAQMADYTRTINSAGNSTTINSNIYEWSVGEMALVSTFTQSGMMVSQGVLQTDDQSTGITDASKLNDLIHVFPNPSNSLLNLQYNFEKAGALAYSLMDVTGRTILRNSVNVMPGQNTQTFSVESIANGHYMLNVYYQPTDATSGSTISFKIEKY